MPLTELADLHARGKVRDIFEAGPDLLMVATDLMEKDWHNVEVFVRNYFGFKEWGK